MISYLIKYRPFNSELQQVIVVSDEFTIVFGTALLVALYYCQGDPDKSYNIGMAILGVVAFSLLKNMSIIVYVNVRDSYRKLRTWVHKKLSLKGSDKIRVILFITKFYMFAFPRINILNGNVKFTIELLKILILISILI